MTEPRKKRMRLCPSNALMTNYPHYKDWKNNITFCDNCTKPHLKSKFIGDYLFYIEDVTKEIEYRSNSLTSEIAMLREWIQLFTPNPDIFPPQRTHYLKEKLDQYITELYYLREENIHYNLIKLCLKYPFIFYLLDEHSSTENFSHFSVEGLLLMIKQSFTEFNFCPVIEKIASILIKFQTSFLVENRKLSNHEVLARATKKFIHKGMKIIYSVECKIFFIIVKKFQEEYKQRSDKNKYKTAKEVVFCYIPDLLNYIASFLFNKNYMKFNFPLN